MELWIGSGREGGINFVGIYLYIYLSVCLSVRLSVCPQKKMISLNLSSIRNQNTTNKTLARPFNPISHFSKYSDEKKASF